MAYTDYNYQTKKALKDDMKAGKAITVFQPGPFGNQACDDGTVYLEGPHYPEPHKWYAQAVVKDGILVSIK